MIQAWHSQKFTWKYGVMVSASSVHKSLHLKTTDNFTNTSECVFITQRITRAVYLDILSMVTQEWTGRGYGGEITESSLMINLVTQHGYCF